ncbi:MAG TPA: hypothetical protein VKH34_05840 [Vicinamibacterales bacterium]|nr:hypothetical protein [Vicinamibacterales bacterium]
MEESFLLEQLARIRKLTADLEKMSRSVADLPQELARCRESINKGPLDGVRDCRVYWCATSLEPASEPASESEPPERRDR